MYVLIYSLLLVFVFAPKNSETLWGKVLENLIMIFSNMALLINTSTPGIFNFPSVLILIGSILYIAFMGELQNIFEN